MRRKVAVIIQRWGEGLLGGAEAHARSLAVALAASHDVTVLTSCASDALRWDRHYAPGVVREGDITVMRFDHPRRNEEGRARVPRRHKLRWLLRCVSDTFGVPRVARASGDDVADGHRFLRRQGPCCTDLVDTLRANRGAWDAAVFFTALYYPTAEGLPAWRGPSVLVPTLHDEKPMYLPCMREAFVRAGRILWNTGSEARLARRLYGEGIADGPIVGLHVDVAEPDAARRASARARFGLVDRYLVYVGRIERGKGCAELERAWRELGRAVGDAQLVFIGKGSHPLLEDTGVRSLGFLPREDRDAVVAGAAALVQPSRLESLSLVMLEAMALGVPVLANADCDVLADLVQVSRAGTLYRGRRALRHALLQALERRRVERDAMAAAGRAFVESVYTRARVESEWLSAIDHVCAARATTVPE